MERIRVDMDCDLFSRMDRFWDDMDSYLIVWIEYGPIWIAISFRMDHFGKYVDCHLISARR